MEYAIIENGEVLNIDEFEKEYLLSKQMIYECDECGDSLLHVDMHFTIEEVEAEIKEIRGY